MKREKIYLSTLCASILLYGCNEKIDRIAQKIQEVEITNEPLAVQIVPQEKTPNTYDLTMYSFLRCADIALTQIKEHPNDYTYNLLDEDCFNSQEPLYLIQKTTRSKVRYKKHWYGNKYYWDYKYVYNKYYTFGQKTNVNQSDEVYTRVSYNDVLKNYFEGNLFGYGYTPSVQNNRETTGHIYQLFKDVFEEEIKGLDIFNEIYNQDAEGKIIFIPLDEVYKKYEAYKDYKPNLDILKFENYISPMPRNMMQPVINYYLYLKYQEYKNQNPE
jgi:hypothetical protein